MKRLRSFAAAGAIFAGLLIAAVPASADGEFVTGVNWKSSSENEKLAYLMGISNLMSADYYLQNKGGRGRGSAIPELYTALSDVTVEQAAAAIDGWYAANPDKNAESVLDVIWLTLVETPK